MPHYDAIVIGSGQAGNPLSQKLADHGWAVALVEKEHLGGTCVNTGCTPAARSAQRLRGVPRLCHDQPDRKLDRRDGAADLVSIRGESG